MIYKYVSRGPSGVLLGDFIDLTEEDVDDIIAGVSTILAPIPISADSLQKEDKKR